MTSVTAVSNTPDAIAGSTPLRASASGIVVPANPATSSVTIIASAKTAPIPTLSNQIAPTVPVRIANRMP